MTTCCISSNHSFLFFTPYTMYLDRRSQDPNTRNKDENRQQHQWYKHGQMMVVVGESTESKKKKRQLQSRSFASCHKQWHSSFGITKVYIYLFLCWYICFKPFSQTCLNNHYVLGFNIDSWSTYCNEAGIFICLFLKLHWLIFVRRLMNEYIYPRNPFYLT